MLPRSLHQSHADGPPLAAGARHKPTKLFNDVMVQVDPYDTGYKKSPAHLHMFADARVIAAAARGLRGKVNQQRVPQISACAFCGVVSTDSAAASPAVLLQGSQAAVAAVASLFQVPVVGNRFRQLVRPA